MAAGSRRRRNQTGAWHLLLRGSKMFLRTLRAVFRVVLKMVARIDMTGLQNLPTEGGAIVVTNHIGRLDAMIGVILAEREDIILMIADKYERVPLWRWLGNNLNAIWLDREVAGPENNVS